MTFTMLAGFSAIGGILAGYFTARVAPLRVLFALWAVAILAALLFYLWMSFAAFGDPFILIAILMAGLVPFAACTILAGGIGLIVRRTIAQEPEA